MAEPVVRSLAQLKEEIGSRYNSTYIPPGELAAFLVDLIINVEGLVPLDETAPASRGTPYRDSHADKDNRVDKPGPKNAPLFGR